MTYAGYVVARKVADVDRPIHDPRVASPSSGDRSQNLLMDLGERAHRFRQGGRDDRVTTADDLARGQAGLADGSDVTIRVYDADDHMSSPAQARTD